VKLKLPQPGTYGVTEAEGTPAELAEFVRALGKEQQAAPPILIPTVWTLDVCPMGGAHQYPLAWWSVSPPACEKCFQAQAVPPQWTVTWVDQEVSPNPMPPCRTTTILGKASDGNS
jgi:hypothetical protein